MQNKIKPEVTVVITNYNYAEFLPQAIESVLAQTYENIKLLIFDDASSDSSMDILGRYTGKAEIIRHEKNKGVIYTRNEALDKVTSPYILFLDADDWFDINYVETLIVSAETDGSDVAYCGMQYFVNGEKERNWIPPEFNLERLKNENYIHMSTLIRVDAIGDVRFDENMERLTHEDWDFFLSLALRGLKFKRVEGVTLNYRLKPGGRNLSNRSEERKFADLYRYIYEKYNNIYPDEIGYLAYYQFTSDLLRVSQELDEVSRRLNDQGALVDSLKSELNAVRDSRSYKLGRMMTLPLRPLIQGKGRPRYLNIRTQIQNKIKELQLYRYIEDSLSEKHNKGVDGGGYFLRKDGEFNKTSKYAVVLHLYYSDSWQGLFAEKLKVLSDSLKYDLYVTMPEENQDYIKEIRKSFNSANILIVPNKGRDVLPFIKTANLLSKNGYESVLKIHSKKSTHREDGQGWLEGMVEALLPSQTVTIESIRQVLDIPDTGIVGPSGVYYPLTVNFPANGPHMSRVVRGRYGKKTEHHYLQSHRADYGFFGGTMFWARLDAIEPLLGFSAARFERESGQIDATFAHALERLFCIVPEIEGRRMYEVSAEKGVVERSYRSDNIPEWSEDHMK